MPRRVGELGALLLRSGTRSLTRRRSLPGGTAAGERIRALLKDPAVELSPQAEALLFAAARAELVAGVIRPALAEGRESDGDPPLCYVSPFAYRHTVGEYLRP